MPLVTTSAKPGGYFFLVSNFDIYSWTPKHIKHWLLQPLPSVAAKQDTICRAKQMVLRLPTPVLYTFWGGYFGLALIRLNECSLAVTTPEVCFSPRLPGLLFFFILSKRGMDLCSETSSQYKPSTVSAGDLLQKCTPEVKEWGSDWSDEL